MLLPSITLREPLQLPVEVIRINGFPKVIAGNIPVTPINITLKWKQENRGATPASLETYARAAQLFVEFAAHRGRSLIDVTNEEFRWFTQALLGPPFLDAGGHQRQLTGERVRGPRTADNIIALLYSIAADLQELYQIKFDWYRYRGVPNELIELVRVKSGKSNVFRRSHRVPYTPRKILALPDEEFCRLVLAAHDKWGNTISDGDIAFAENPADQCGALFYRNLAILLSLRHAGARRSEPSFITLDDIDRENRRIYLVTKGHGGPKGKRLPVVLNPSVESAIWLYVTRYRPITEENSVKGYPVFVSHSTRNYGRQISAQSVRKIIDALRENLTPPWDELISPHTLRHSFSSDLQKHGNEAAVVINMRHASLSSLRSYHVSPEVFADELLASADTRLTNMLSKFGIEIIR